MTSPSPDALRKLAEDARDLLEKAKGQDYGFVSYVCGRDPARIYTMDEVKFADALLAATRSIAELQEHVDHYYGIVDKAIMIVGDDDASDEENMRKLGELLRDTLPPDMRAAARQALAEEERRSG